MDEVNLSVARNAQGSNGLDGIKARWHGQCIGTAQIMKTHQANTYDLILASESEDKRGFFLEMVVYALFMLSAVAGIVSAAAQPAAAPNRTAETNYQLEERA